MRTGMREDVNGVMYKAYIGHTKDGREVVIDKELAKASGEAAQMLAAEIYAAENEETQQ